jgi:hypothetical protein
LLRDAVGRDDLRSHGARSEQVSVVGHSMIVRIRLFVSIVSNFDVQRAVWVNGGAAAAEELAG